jgi:uncharacterized iron-regulated protein
MILLVLVLMQTAAPPSAVPSSGYIPERVYDSVSGRFTDFEAMLAEVSRADVVFVGEAHDDPNTHRLELAILEGLKRRRADVALGLEMFERDVQEQLSSYGDGRIGEDEFLSRSRPWPRYATDYRPLVEFARASRWPILATNVPRRLASAVAKGGLDVIAPGDDRALYAADVQCPRDDYFDRFEKSMSAHPMPGAETRTDAENAAIVERFYLAQCLKDETMAESIARARAASGPLVVHVNGAFHSDFGDGVPERVRRRLPQLRLAVLSMLPVDDLDAVAPAADDRKRADYLVYTLAPPR